MISFIILEKFEILHFLQFYNFLKNGNLAKMKKSKNNKIKLKI